MASLPLPQTLVLPPLGITLNDQGKMQLNWLPQQGQTVAAGLAPEVRQQIAAAVLAGESATVLHARLPGIESALLHTVVAGNEVIERSALSGLMADVPLFPGILEAHRARNSVFFWYGPAGTVTPLHHDPCNIVLTQIRGRKKLKLYSPMQTPLLYNELGVFSRVDAERPDLEAYPQFAGAAAMETELAPGEALFIPVGWWHHVRSLDVAVSVSATCFAAPNSYGWDMPSFGARRTPPRAN